MTRLIDANVVIKHIEEYWEMVKRGKPSRGMTEVMQNIKTIVNSLQTVDAVPVRHGMFIGTESDGYADGNPVYYEWKCSECGCIFEEEEPTYRYCPNCGARMDKEDDTKRD